MFTSKTILILGCSTKAGAFVAKQFKKAGYEIIIYDWKNLPNQYSKYVDRYVECSSPEEDLQLFSDAFLMFLASTPPLAILPLHDAALEIVRYLQKQIPTQTKILGLNPDEVYKFAHNKWELQKLAEKNGILVPKTVYIDSLSQIEQLKNLVFPCIIKPVSSALFKDGRLYAFRVHTANDKHRLIDLLREIVPNIPVMIQEFIEGPGIGFNFISYKGEVLNSYIHRRINEYDGVSSYREMLDPNAYQHKKKKLWISSNLLAGPVLECLNLNLIKLVLF